MKRYWMKIAFGALLIFCLGYGAVYGLRQAKSAIINGHDITIPLGSFIHFNLDGVPSGTISSLTLQRSGERQLTGFGIRVRLADESGFDRLQNCHVSVNDAENIDENTRFTCLTSDAGYEPFGELRASIKGVDRLLVIPLYLPSTTIRDIQRDRNAENYGGPSADSIARAVRARIQPHLQNYADSVRAARLDKKAEDYKRQADSIRQKALEPPAEPAAASKPAKPPA